MICVLSNEFYPPRNASFLALQQKSIQEEQTDQLILQLRLTTLMSATDISYIFWALFQEVQSWNPVRLLSGRRHAPEYNFGRLGIFLSQNVTILPHGEQFRTGF
jgi:hypothetical protein